MKKTLPSTLPVKRNIHFAEMFRSQQPLRVGWIWSALVLAGVGGWLPSANGQTPTVWSGGPGNWSTIANWSGGFVPNNGNGGQNWSAFIDSGNAANSVVQLDVSSSISQLHISAGDTLNILDNRSLSIVGGVVNNNGTISLAWGGNPTFLAFNGSTSIAGTGSIDMTGGSFITGSGMLTNGVGHTIRGSGNLGSNSIFVINQGTVEAGTGFSMLIDPQNAGAGTVAFNNQGTVRAIGGGVVTLTGNGAGEFWGSGTYQATGAGSRIDLVGDVVIRNTTLAASAGGEIRAANGNNQTLDNVSLSGNFVRRDNGVTFLSNAISNSGTMTLDFGGNATAIQLISNVALSGGGSINMLGGGGAIAGSGNLLTNVDNTISGSGNRI